MRKNSILSLVAASLLAAAITGCGSSDDTTAVNNDGDTSTQASSGTFQDSATAGLGYNCTPSNKSGYTDQDGKYDYLIGDICNFTLGNIALGTTMGANTVTPADLLENTDPVNAYNMVRLLMSLDSDGDASNGIDIDSAAVESVTGLDINFTDPTAFDVSAIAVLDALSIPTLVDLQTATAHFDETLAALYSTQISDAMFIGKSMTIERYTGAEVFVFNDNGSFTSTLSDGDDTNLFQVTTGTWEIVENGLALSKTFSSVDGPYLLEQTLTFDSAPVSGTKAIVSMPAETGIPPINWIVTEMKDFAVSTQNVTTEMVSNMRMEFLQGFSIDFNTNGQYTFIGPDCSGNWSLDGNAVHLSGTCSGEVDETDMKFSKVPMEDGTVAEFSRIGMTPAIFSLVEIGAIPVAQ